MTWQKIETAPSREDVMLWVIPKPLAPWPCFIVPHSGRLHIGKLQSWSSLEIATHWMPLPPAPPEDQP